jgi:hypothetical protein
MATDWTTGDRIPEGARDFSLLENVQTDSVSHPASYSMVAGPL